MVKSKQETQTTQEGEETPRPPNIMAHLGTILQKLQGFRMDKDEVLGEPLEEGERPDYRVKIRSRGKGSIDDHLC